MTNKPSEYSSSWRANSQPWTWKLGTNQRPARVVNEPQLLVTSAPFFFLLRFSQRKKENSFCKWGQRIKSPASGGNASKQKRKQANSAQSGFAVRSPPRRTLLSRRAATLSPAVNKRFKELQPVSRCKTTVFPPSHCCARGFSPRLIVFRSRVINRCGNH